MTARVRRVRRADDGTALVMALAVLAFVGVLSGALLTMLRSGFTAESVAQDQAAQDYAANAAIDGAVRSLALSTSTGVDPYDATCFTLPAGEVNTTGAITVRCAAETGSGAGGSGPAPAQAVLTTSTDANEGVEVGPNLTVKTTGGWQSAQRMYLGNYATLSDTTASVAKSCNFVYGAVVLPSVNCSGTPTADPGYIPTYGGAALTYPPLATAPSCPGSKVITLSPGTYSDGNALSALTNGSCAGALLWFQPGVYYLDFTTVSGSVPNDHVWTINDANVDVVGGTLNFALPGSRPSSVPFPTVGSATKGCDTTKSGVIIVLGGDSRIDVQSGKVQLCGQPYASGQEITVWGPASDRSVTGTSSSATAAPTAAWAGNCTSPGDATDPLTSRTRHHAVTTAGGTCTLASTGNNLSALVPSTATNLTLNVTVPQALSGTGTSSVKLVAASGTTTLTAGDCSASCPVEGELDRTLSFPVTLADLSNLSLTYQLTGAASKTLSGYVDSLTATIGFTAPLRATSGNAVITGYSAGNSWTYFLLRASNSGRLMVSGTVAIPRGVFEESETSLANTVVDRGVIARHVLVGGSIAGGFTGSVFSVPASASPAPRKLVLQASLNGTVVLTAEVKLADLSGAANGSVATVLSWSHS